ncbi:MAG: hypothetical protein L0Y58_09525 [Verrucomicrobia subdivision 3 bacterium]|nr:hypothetical protein [Limisphaerales bacterium]
MRRDINWEDYLGEEVVDRRSDPVGRLECCWTDGSDQPMYLGISTEEDRHLTYVVPASMARFEERYSCVRLTLPAIKVRQAPQLECDKPIDTAFEKRLGEHFHLEVAEHPTLHAHKH